MWGMFERYVAEQLGLDESHRSTIFAGPILAGDDPSADFGGGPIKYPRRFWKIVCFIPSTGNAKLAVYSFLFDQGPIIDKFGIEALTLQNFAAEQTTVAHIEEAAGLTFPKVLHDHDVLKQGGGNPKPLANVDEIYIGK